MTSKIIALVLSIIMLFGCSLTLISCSDEAEPPFSEGNDEYSPDEEFNSSDGDNDENIKVPEYKDHERGTINFSEIEYTRPKIDEVVAKFDAVTEIITENPKDIPYAIQLEKIMSLEADFIHIKTMYTYSNIKMSENISDKYWCDEHEYIAVGYPSFSKAVEDLFVAAANSPHAENFEKDYFGDDLIEEYKDGGSYTDALVALMEEEMALEAEYSSFSTASTVITYKGMTDTVDNILEYYGNLYGRETAIYIQIENDCHSLYDDAVAKRSKEIFISLMKVRRLIGTEYGYQSYSAIAYADYHDYSEAEAIKFIRDIAKYMFPVYTKLNNFVFYPYFYTYNPTTTLTPNKVVNDLASLYETFDEDIYSVYSYMLQHDLYSCDLSRLNRYEGSFATYLDAYNAPFLFTSFYGSIDDYMTMSHEFGHFLDSYLNYSNDSSLDLSEVSSTAFEFLTMSALRPFLSDGDAKYLSYAQLDSAMQVLIFQGFYALFEHYAYAIDYDSISEKTLTDAMQKAAADMGFTLNQNTSLDIVIIPHTVLYPFYVQSYCTSTAVALEIYFKEAKSEGDGLRAYKSLIYRCDDISLVQHLERSGLSSPFAASTLKALADSIHYEILGSHYYTEGGDLENAA